MIDTDKLLAPVSETSPCGPDIEDDEVCAADPEAMAQQGALLTLDALHSEARRADPSEADWGTVENLAGEFLRTNKHLRVAVYLCDAAMRRHHLGGLFQALELVRKLCETYWDALHPLATTRGGKQSRVNILGGLGGKTFLAALRNARFVDGVPTATLKTLEGMMIDAGSDEDTAAREFARSVLGTQPQERLEGSRKLADAAADHVRWILTRVETEYAPDDEVNCGDFISEVGGQFLRMIDSMCRILSHACGTPVAEAVPESGSGESAGAPVPPQSGALTKDRIRQMLDQIIDHYRKHEPSSPVPLLLLRAKRSMDLDFMELLSDTAGEDAVRKAQVILGGGKED